MVYTVHICVRILITPINNIVNNFFYLFSISVICEALLRKESELCYECLFFFFSQ